jgi:hypothetical protein
MESREQKTSPLRDTRSRGYRLAMTLMALAVLVPSLYGFGTKFFEFIALYRGEPDGAFAIAPILNYLLASSGFLLLFGWAMLNGMFRDIEAPKHAMLENEARLDAETKALGWPLAQSPTFQRARWRPDVHRERGLR